MDIRRRGALMRSNLYLRPKISTSEPETSNPPDVEAPLEMEQPGVMARSVDQPGIIARENFYIISDADSDEEEVLLASPVRTDHDEGIDLVSILNGFRGDNCDPHESCVVVARRRHILTSACGALAKSFFHWHREPHVEFVGEMADDYGGPRREFFRLLNCNKYYTAVKLTAWSIVHNGPGPRSINRCVYKMMYGQRPDLASFDTGLLVEGFQAQHRTADEDLSRLKTLQGRLDRCLWCAHHIHGKDHRYP
ncbi:hypothetical protein AALO_G00239600 [Alosa alosa]|uniref:HECT domain-containing protein n=1 Tax=Alosa alosa TaxID=278164 RepID=A0AAV6FZ67_9TELE|nr:hypothetical protein AALO_G00239600 [Alosa alosa]